MLQSPVLTRNFAACIAIAITFVCGCAEPPPPDAKPGCNPVSGDDCLTPFPSSFYLADDPTTMTGVRVHIADDALPLQGGPGGRLKPDRLNQKDGFSPSMPFFVYFKAGVDATMLPGPDQLDQSMQPTSAVQVIELSTGERVPTMAELDLNAQQGDRQALIVRPMKRLKPATRYVVALVRLKDAAGQPLLPAPFKALRDKTTLSRSLQPLAARYEEIFAGLEKAGVRRGTLTLAWDVTTASDQTATGHLMAMRDTALSMLAAGQLGYSIGSSTDSPNDPYLLREILATVKVPSYLADDSGKSMMNFGADGQPAVRAIVDVPFVVHIPQCARAATAPLPVVVFGHGLFGNALDTLRELKKTGNDLCAVLIATDWIGLSTSDISNVAGVVSSDLNSVYLVTDRLQQAHVNAQVMTKTVLTQMKDDDAMKVNGRPVTDGSQAYYLGVSLGGIQGGAFMALSPEIVRGVLNVPGCTWSLLMFRSVAFNSLKPILTSALPDALDGQVAIGVTQSEWDYSDPATFAPHLLSDPLPGVPAKRILVQESIGDALVSNLSTRILVRTMGLAGVELIEPTFGVDQKALPLGSAYTQWDSHPTPLPPTGDLALAKDNGAHEAIFGSAVAQKQIQAFLQPDGQVVDVCGGPCNVSQ